MEPATNKPRAIYTSDVSNAEWDFCRPYLVLMREDAPQREYPLRELFNALRYIVRCGCQWRMMPHDLPPWQNVYQQAQRWMKACCFEAMAHDLRELSRLAKGRKAQPTAAITLLHNDYMSPLFLAAIEATEEAIVNSLFMAETTTGTQGNTIPALPREKVMELMKKYGRVK